MHCADPGCLKACPAPGAIVQYSNGIVDFVHENCIGCGYCVKGCPFNIPRISKVDNKAYKCTLCSDRVAVGQGPACAKACPTQAIVFGTKDDMKKHADGRIKDLKSRGFKNAGLYDPPGVGGTHVMYVLHHADQPEIYAGLPNNPRISPLVELWKGVDQICRPGRDGRLRGRRRSCTTSSQGPNRVTREDEENAKRLAGEQTAMTRRTTSKTGDARPSGRSGHGRPLHGGRARQPLDHGDRASCCSRSPASRCSIRACSSSPRLFGGGQTTRAIHPWIGVVLFFSFAGLFLRFWQANLWKRRGRHLAGAAARCADRPRGQAARGRQVQCRPEGRVLGDVAPDHRADRAAAS